MISVDSKKKESIGRYSNGGAEHASKGDPEATNTHDFIGALGKSAPYGFCDVAENTEWVNVGTDGGGSNGSRLRLWKAEPAKRATETGPTITVCRLPPGTSKWNKIEHRTFSATTAKTGLTIQAGLDTNPCDERIKITDQQMRAFEASHLQRQDFRGDWDYTVRATPHENTTPPEPQDHTALKRREHRTGTPARRTTGDPHASPHLPW